MIIDIWLFPDTFCTVLASQPRTAGLSGNSNSTEDCLILAADTEDLECIAAVRAGSREAFAMLVSKYQTRVRTFCYNVLLDRTSAEDAAQEVFLKVFYRLDGFRGDAQFSTWLYRIAVNHCRDILRKGKRNRAASWDQMAPGKQDAVSLRSEQCSTEHTFESRDLVTKIFAHLSPEYREVLCLRDVQDLSYEQIARTLNCTLDTVKGRIKRARAELLSLSRRFFSDRDDPLFSERGGK
jgi:RNA polymerase sigma-70 factor (ECF subfamily)